MNLRAKLKSLSLCKSLVFLVVSPSLEVLRKWLRGTAGAEIQQLLLLHFVYWGIIFLLKRVPLK